MKALCTAARDMAIIGVMRGGGARPLQCGSWPQSFLARLLIGILWWILDWIFHMFFLQESQPQKTRHSLLKFPLDLAHRLVCSSISDCDIVHHLALPALPGSERATHATMATVAWKGQINVAMVGDRLRGPLVKLKLERNKISGPFPSAVTSLAKLRYLGLASNRCFDWQKFRGCNRASLILC